MSSKHGRRSKSFSFVFRLFGNRVKTVLIGEKLQKSGSCTSIASRRSQRQCAHLALGIIQTVPVTCSSNNPFFGGHVIHANCSTAQIWSIRTKLSNGQVFLFRGRLSLFVTQCGQSICSLRHVRTPTLPPTLHHQQLFLPLKPKNGNYIPRIKSVSSLPSRNLMMIFLSPIRPLFGWHSTGLFHRYIPTGAAVCKAQ